MNLEALILKVKKHPNYDRVGMILCHNGVVRGTSINGRKVSGLRISVDRDALRAVLAEQMQRPGIVDIQVEIAENRTLRVGEDVMLLVVAGDIRDHVIPVLKDTLNAIKSTVTHKTEYYG